MIKRQKTSTGLLIPGKASRNTLLIHTHSLQMSYTSTIGVQDWSICLYFLCISCSSLSSIFSAVLLFLREVQSRYKLCLKSPVSGSMSSRTQSNNMTIKSVSEQDTQSVFFFCSGSVCLRLSIIGTINLNQETILTSASPIPGRVFESHNFGFPVSLMLMVLVPYVKLFVGSY